MFMYFEVSGYKNKDLRAKKSFFTFLEICYFYVHTEIVHSTQGIQNQWFSINVKHDFLALKSLFLFPDTSKYMNIRILGPFYIYN